VTRDVAPLQPRHRNPPGRLLAREASAVQAAPPSKPALAAAPPASSPVRPEPPLDSLAGIDRANAERLKRGRHAVEARLDLHGLTQAEAYRELAGFVASSQAAGRRCVLVITGRGRLGGGILRSAVPRWLSEPGLRPRLLGIAPAQPHHGGGGALYLLLRRIRQD
jgi:DNA-nicking Smr family endonuclease